MRTLLAAVLLMFTLPSLADSYIDLYQAGGWPQQRAHFRDALSSAQQRYRNSLPPAIYQALVDNSNQRFTAAGMDQRALAGLRQLSDPQPALAFFQSPLGRKIIAAETAQAAQNAASKEVGAAKARGDDAEFERLRALVEARVDADRMIAATHSALAADADLLEPAELQAIHNLIAQLSQTLTGDTTAAIESATEALAKGTEAFAAMRMNRGIQHALAGKRLEEV